MAAHAALRLIPTDAHAVGVRVVGTHVTPVVQAPGDSAASYEDIDDIVDELELLLGPDVQVSKLLIPAKPSPACPRRRAVVLRVPGLRLDRVVLSQHDRTVRVTRLGS
jgi:hypothetical protein